MIDHVLGRPSVKFRKIQVLTVMLFWSVYLLRGNKHGPPVLRRISRRLSKRLTPWQTLVTTMMWLYISRNFAKIVGLESPEPLANLYTRSYFRATWLTTALDAGFWTAMRIKQKWLRDLCSVIFSIYYMICAEQADEKVRRVRATLTVDHLRVSWNKSTTPYLSRLNSLLRPNFTKYKPRAIRIPRPPESSYTEPVDAYLYFDGPLSALKGQTNVVLDIPGGGFVAMDPRTNDDKLLAWAGKTGYPILSLNYKKAPEFPYPYALNECYDVYHTLIASRGRCIGLSGAVCPRIVLTGDSAGGNLATGVVLMVLQSSGTDAHNWHGSRALPTPDGLILIYPGLDMNIGNWMTDEQMALIQDRQMRKTNRNVLHRKSEDYYHLDPHTPHHSDDEKSESPSRRSHESSSSQASPGSRSNKGSRAKNDSVDAPKTSLVSEQAGRAEANKPRALNTRLAMSSMISYFNDRILTPETMRAMIILYIGPHSRPDFSTDFLLSPVLAPEALLARFPKVCFLTGERDPLVDDTVIFAGRIRRAKFNRFHERQELGLIGPKARFNERAHVQVTLIPGISHGFMQFAGVFPEAWKHIFKCARWVKEIFATPAHALDGNAKSGPGLTLKMAKSETGFVGTRHHRRIPTDSSADEDNPLEMTSASRSPYHSRRPSARVRGRSRRSSIGSADGGGGIGGLAWAAGWAQGSSRRRRSLVSLASEEDLLGRRMKGLTGGLLSMEEWEVKTP